MSNSRIYKRYTPEQMARRAAASRKYANVNPDKVRVAHRANARRKRVDAAGREPTNCDVCAVPIAYDATGAVQAHYDHDHGTDNFRGWLCRSCNIALGVAGDNPAVLRALAVYLVARGFTPTRG